MRRRSFIGPLILIAIGVLFLIRNVWPELQIFDTVMRSWPYLLIGWGVLRLAELLIWASRGRPMPATGLSGGEWALVILICIAGSAWSGVRDFRARWPNARISERGIEIFGENYDYPVTGELAKAGKTPRILVENLRGNARITGADTEDVKITGRKSVKSIDKDDADKANSQTPLEVTRNGDQIVIRTNQERTNQDRRVSSDLEITVPRGASIEARGRYGDFEISDINGRVDINSDNAGVRLQNITGDIRTDLRRSDIIRAVNVKGNCELKSARGQQIEVENVDGQVTVNGEFSGEIEFRGVTKPVRFESSATDVRVQRVPGSLRFALGSLTAENLIGPVQVSTRRSKDVQITDFTEEVTINVERGDIELRQTRLPVGKIDVKTRSGNVELALPASAKFQMSAVTDRGEIENDFGGGLTLDPSGQGSSLKGAVAGGGAAIAINTHRGQITVRKAVAGDSEPRTTVLPEAPHPPVTPPKPIVAEELKVEKQ